MGTWFRVIFLGLLALGLSGCILESKKPLFADADAKLLLANYPNLSYYELDSRGWQKSEEAIIFTLQGTHYAVKPEPDETEIQFFFVPIEGQWWVLQANAGMATSYMLVKVEPKELLVYPLDCKTLQESGKLGNEIEFKDSSCFIKDGADKMGLFKALIGSASEPSTKLVSEG
ncbi:MAG: hypothetical protein Q8L53_03340 [Aestuariivirga sp.]|nr:hypothetical protein [Aestuariivirga sp.]